MYVWSVDFQCASCAYIQCLFDALMVGTSPLMVVHSARSRRGEAFVSSTTYSIRQRDPFIDEKVPLP